jgi:hypothetical protein
VGLRGLLFDALEEQAIIMEAEINIGGFCTRQFNTYQNMASMSLLQKDPKNRVREAADPLTVQRMIPGQSVLHLAVILVPSEICLSGELCIRAPILLFLLKKLVDFGHEFADILELKIDGGEPQIGNLIYPPELGKKDLPDGNRIQLTLRAFLNVLFHLVDDLLELCEADRSLFACFEKPVQNLVPIESFPAAVLFHNHVGYFITSFIAGEASAAVQALASAPD